MIKLCLTTKVSHADGQEDNHQGRDNVRNLGEFAHWGAGEARDAADEREPGEDPQLHEDRHEAKHGHKKLHEAARRFLVFLSVPHDSCGDECFTLGATHI